MESPFVVWRRSLLEGDAVHRRRAARRPVLLQLRQGAADEAAISAVAHGVVTAPSTQSPASAAAEGRMCPNLLATVLRLE